MMNLMYCSRYFESSLNHLVGTKLWPAASKLKLARNSHFNTEFHRAEYGVSKAMVLVRTSVRKPIGILVFQREYDYINDAFDIGVFVHPEHRRTGVGSGLLREFHRRYGQKNAIHVYPWNASSTRFFEKNSNLNLRGI